MSTMLANATNAAHSAVASAAASLLSTVQIAPGQELPKVDLKEDSAEHAAPINVSSGKVLIIGVPGAFTGTCSKQIPAYIEQYDAFKAKGISDIYVVGINDHFCMSAWKEKLAPNGTPIHFMADDQGTFTSATGLVFDATPLLGGPRSKRYAMIVEDGKVLYLFIEENPGEVKVTDAKTVLAHL